MFSGRQKRKIAQEWVKINSEQTFYIALVLLLLVLNLVWRRLVKLWEKSRKRFQFDLNSMRQYYVYYSKGSVAPFTFSSKDNLSTGISSNFTFTVILSVFYLQLYLNGFSINIKIRIKILYKIYFLKTKTCSKSASKT